MRSANAATGRHNRPVHTLQPLIDFLHRHPRLLVLTGAGCSTAAGIPDYRDEQGRWKRAEPMRHQTFVGSALARQHYRARSMQGWPALAAARPTAAHHALARLEQAGRIVQLVTQNVDGLHQAAGSRAVVDLHGRLDTVVCLGCAARTPRAALQQELQRRNPHWLAPEAARLPDGDADLRDLDFSRFEVPHCPRCGGVLKPDVVFFGDSVPRERVAAVREALAQADAVLVAGSSLMVYSGYRFVEEAAASGKPVAAINRGRTRADTLLTLKVEMDVGAALQQLAQAGTGARAA